MAPLAVPTMSGPGLLFVLGKISRPDLMDEATYMNWYDNDHIAEILETPSDTAGIKTAFRFIHADHHEANWPYLALYPMEDLAFLNSEGFRKITVHSKLLPGSGLIYDLADNEVRYYALKSIYDATKRGKGHTKAIVPAQFDGVQDVDATKAFGAHVGGVSQVPGYLRTTTFKLEFARTGAQSRALKGLPTTDEPEPEPPTWLSFHEFDTESVDAESVSQIKTASVVDGAVLRDAPVYKIAVTHGEGDWHHGIQLLS